MISRFAAPGWIRRLGVLAVLGGLVLLLTGTGSSASRAAVSARSTAAPAAQRDILALALPHEAALSRYVAAEYDPRSKAFHHFLSPAAFTRRFAAPAGEIDRVISRLRGLGITGAQVAANHLYVSVALSGRSAHRTAQLTSALSGLVSGVITPAQQPTLTPLLRRAATTTSAATTTTPVATTTTPATGTTTTIATTTIATTTVRPGVDGGATPCAAADAAHGYTAPQLASAYDFNGLYAQGLHGEGMSAAVLEYGGYHTSNIATFESCYGLSIPVDRILVDGGSGADAGSSEVEVALDIEVLEEMAPKLAHVYVYEAPNTGTGELGAYNAFVTQDRAPVLSVSWGECEEGASQAYQRLLGAITEEGAAQGQQIFVAAGDTGSRGCSGEALPTGASVSTDSEASLPWVTGVGGTDLSEATTEVGATVHREDTWNDGLGAGGGGESVTFAMPSWQRDYLNSTGDHVPGLTDDCGAPASQGCRMEPDISMDADAEEGGADPDQWGVPAGPTPASFSSVGDLGSPGYSIYCATTNCDLSHSGYGRVGGTSAATPLSAAAAILYDEDADRAGVSLGFLNPSLYAIAANPASYARDFHDITVGSNTDSYTELACDAACSKLYDAGSGYDMASGLGSMDVANLAGDLLSQAGAISLTPSSETVYGDTGGGPSTTADVSVTAPSRPGVSSAYTATSSAPWLVVAPSASAPDSLSWHVDPTGLAAGTYTGTITVTAADGSTATLAVTYEVTPPARIHLSTTSLHFTEHQVKILGQKHEETCGVPLWGDELENSGTLPALIGITVAGDEAPGTRHTLAFTNAGAPGSELHWALDQTHVAWISNDLDPNNDPRGVRTSPRQPLVPSVGTVGHGGHAGVKLASIANSNTVGGYPSLQQGTYHGTLVIDDLADPADDVRVPVTLTLGDGRGTPRLGISARSLAVSLAPGTSKRVTLTLSDPGGACGYGYSVQTNATWLSPSPTRRVGQVGAHTRRAVPFTVSAPADEAPGTYHATISIASLNAAQSLLRVPVTLTVR